jgi:hypothetical protein
LRRGGWGLYLQQFFLPDGLSVLANVGGYLP